jgi:hypothetical protein
MYTSFSLSRAHTRAPSLEDYSLAVVFKLSAIDVVVFFSVVGVSALRTNARHHESMHRSQNKDLVRVPSSGSANLNM